MGELEPREWNCTGMTTDTRGNKKLIAIQSWTRGNSWKTRMIRDRKVDGGGGVRDTWLPLGSHHREASSIQELCVQLLLRETDHTHKHTHRLTHTYLRSCSGLCFELIPATGEAHTESADNNIILWPSYGNMALLLWRNMNIMAFRGSLGNYMPVMVLGSNGIFRLYLFGVSGWEIY